MKHTLHNVIASHVSLRTILFALVLFTAPARDSYTRTSNACIHAPDSGEFFRDSGPPGICGGRLVVSQRSEPKTFNPITAMDFDSRRIVDLLNADLIHINRENFRTEPALAQSWTISADNKTYTVVLRRGVRFSDGSPFDADDVVFSFESYLDESLHSPQRDMLLISGVPIKVRKLNAYKVAFTFPSPYAAGERIFDGIAILPHRLLQSQEKLRDLPAIWGVNTDPKKIVGLGPFRLRAFVPGQRVILERNPFYWKTDSIGQHLPYLDEFTSEIVPNSEVESMRFLSGETEIMNRMTAANFTALKSEEQRRNLRVYDVGPGFEYTFLFFNLNRARASANSLLRQKQKWWDQVEFRRAVAAAIDRDSIVRLVYKGHAVPISVPLSPSNAFWINHNLPAPTRSLSQARESLLKAGFSWARDGSLRDAGGQTVEFSLIVNSANPQQKAMGVLIQQDLKDLGIRVVLNTLEYRSFLHRIFSSFDYEAAILTLADGDADPNTELSLLLSTGTNHVWSLDSSKIPPWQVEIDALMQKQLTTPDPKERKRWFDEVQHLLWLNKPAIFLTSPNILVGAKNEIGNFHPAKLRDYTVWNADRLFNRREQRMTGR